MRPVGGWLSDRVGPVPVLAASFVAAAALAVLAAVHLPLLPLGTVAFLGLAAALGAASGGGDAVRRKADDDLCKLLVPQPQRRKAH
ncbi:MAG: transporter, family, nitrate/nitrite transporter [Pseudonocardiales bacterium]|jgi:nitrate/nitrite transporter NarK|nr:transporter, family, nitrate/nitrite transporter [Pseudonocardiales bacterium]